MFFKKKYGYIFQILVCIILLISLKKLKEVILDIEALRLGNYITVDH